MGGRGRGPLYGCYAKTPWGPAAGRFHGNQTLFDVRNHIVEVEYRTHTRTLAARRIGAPRRPVPAATLLLGLICALATPAGAARVTDVRVGLHPEFTRVVVETDEPATYLLLQPLQLENYEIRVLVDAESEARDARPPGARSAFAVIEPLPSGGSEMRILARGPVVIEEQVIDEPPRIVLDLRDAPERAAVDAGVAIGPAAEVEPAVPVEGELTPASSLALPDVRAAEAVGTTQPESRPPAAPTVSPPAPRIHREGEVEGAGADGRQAAELPPVSQPGAGKAERALPGDGPELATPPLGVPWLAWSLLTGMLLLVFSIAWVAVAISSTRRPRPHAIRSVGPPAAQGPEEITGEWGVSDPLRAGSPQGAIGAPGATEDPASDDEARPHRLEGPETNREPEGPLAEYAPAGPGAGEAEWVRDLLHVFHSLDQRIAKLEQDFAGQQQERERLSAGGETQARELRAQRVALARLQRMLASRMPQRTQTWKRRPGP